MEPARQQKPLIVGDGKTGPLAERLTARGIPFGSVPVRVTTVRWDTRDLGRALQMWIGVSDVLPGPAFPEALAISAASSGAVEPASKRVVCCPAAVNRSAAEREAVRESARFTILRASWFAQNFTRLTCSIPCEAASSAFPAGNSRAVHHIDDMPTSPGGSTDDERRPDLRIDGPRLLTSRRLRRRF